MADIEKVYRALLMGRLNTVQPSFPTARENQTFKETSVAHRAVFFLKGETANPTMGDSYREIPGIMQVTLAYPSGTGTADIDDHADEIIAAFPRGTLLKDGRVGVRVFRTPYASAGFADGALWKVPVTIPYVIQYDNS